MMKTTSVIFIFLAAILTSNFAFAKSSNPLSAFSEVDDHFIEVREVPVQKVKRPAGEKPPTRMEVAMTKFYWRKNVAIRSLAPADPEVVEEYVDSVWSPEIEEYYDSCLTDEAYVAYLSEVFNGNTEFMAIAFLFDVQTSRAVLEILSSRSSLLLHFLRRHLDCYGSEQVRTEEDITSFVSCL
jgi:hypothetical protein